MSIPPIDDVVSGTGWPHPVSQPDIRVISGVCAALMLLASFLTSAVVAFLAAVSA
jgi:hypothetical protein